MVSINYIVNFIVRPTLIGLKFGDIQYMMKSQLWNFTPSPQEFFKPKDFNRSELHDQETKDRLVKNYFLFLTVL